jgi:hypothetical protein
MADDFEQYLAHLFGTTPEQEHAVHRQRQAEAARMREQFPNGCGLCGEPADAEMGEFWQPEQNTSVVAHAQCGIDAGLEIA